jgi:hypothetical protein
MRKPKRLKMKSRRHHNNQGRQQQRTGYDIIRLKRVADQLGVPLKTARREVYTMKPTIEENQLITDAIRSASDALSSVVVELLELREKYKDNDKDPAFHLYSLSEEIKALKSLLEARRAAYQELVSNW